MVRWSHVLILGERVISLISGHEPLPLRLDRHTGKPEFGVQFSVTHQIKLPTPSATSSAPVRSKATPTGRPRASQSEMIKLATKARSAARGYWRMRLCRAVPAEPGASRRQHHQVRMAPDLRPSHASVHPRHDRPVLGHRQQDRRGLQLLGMHHRARARHRHLHHRRVPRLLEFPDLNRKVIALARQQKPKVLLIEDRASGNAAYPGAAPGEP